VSESVAIISASTNDEHLIRLWLHNRPLTTQRAYRRDVAAFLSFTHKPLPAVTLADVQDFADHIAARQTSTRPVAAVKSLLAFGHRIGLLQVDAGAPVKLPARKDTLAERILSEPAIVKMLALTTEPRDYALLVLLYGAGLRIAEACGLRWHDLHERDRGAVVTVFGKGGKTRHILLAPPVWDALNSLRGDAGTDDPVFRSRKHGAALSTVQAWRVVKMAAKRAGLNPAISCHWLRHAAASHSLAHGATLALVQQTLGHQSLAVTGRYLHVNPTESIGQYLAI
jgi:integrase/recombinase XerD